MARIKAFSDGIPPRRTPKQIAQELLNNKLGLHGNLQIAFDATLTPESTVSDFLRAQKYEEMLVLIEDDMRKQPHNQQELGEVYDNIMRYGMVGKCSQKDQRKFEEAIANLDNRRPIRKLVNEILPKIAEDQSINPIERIEIKKAQEMLLALRSMIQKKLAPLERNDARYPVHDMGSLFIIVNLNSQLRVFNSLVETIGELNSKINGISAHRS